jgi:hypothetical protein
LKVSPIYFLLRAMPENAIAIILEKAKTPTKLIVRVVF